MATATNPDGGGPLTKLEAVLAFAHAQIGEPYLWGGEGNGGFDCSGLVQMAYRTAGVALPRVASAQYAATPRVSGPLRVGDLVFFGTPSNVHHVGIYVGNGKMLDAPHTGAKVRIEPLFSDYLGATRPLAGGAGAADTTSPLATPTAGAAGDGDGLAGGFRHIVVESVLVLGAVGLVGLGLWQGVKRQ